MTRSRKALCAALSVILLLSSIFLPSFAAERGYVAATDVNVREDAGTEYKSLGKVSNIQVELLGQKNDKKGEPWYHVQCVIGGKTVTGYIKAEFITVIREVEPAGEFAKQLAAFTESYRAALTALHGAYPNYSFIADNIDIAFSDAVENETKSHRKLVHMTADGDSWKALGPENYNWSTGKWNTYSGSWTDASREVIAYYMDPRNFLDAQSIYMFMRQTYNPASQSEAGVVSLIKGSFLEKGFPANEDDTVYAGSYAKIIMKAAKQSNVNPYVLASTIMLEQGAGTSDLISGKSGFYNFFNYGASGGDVVGNGIKYAKNMGWTSRSKSIIGGAKLYAEGYIAAGQDTYYYKDFDVLDSNPYTHQYAQSVYDARSSGAKLRERYINDHSLGLVFRIPVYKNMPATPQSQPPENKNLNNYYFDSISAAGMTPAFSRYIFNYTISISGNTTVTLKAPAGASYTGANSFSIKAGTQNISLPVRSQTGYYNYYTLKVTSSAECTLYINSGRLLGDINGDGTINTADLAAVKLHLLGKRTLSASETSSADINGDGAINTADLAGIKLHLLGLRKIS